MHQLGEDSLNGLSSLQTLHLADNKLSYLPKKFFASLKNLTALNLKNNNLRTLKNSPGALSSLTALTSLDLSNNQCSFIPEDYLHDLEKLQILNLDNNYLKGLFNIDHNGTFLASMKNLQTLNIRNNYLESVSDAQFRQGSDDSFFHCLFVSFIHSFFLTLTLSLSFFPFPSFFSSYLPSFFLN